jgi:glutamate dehydrogenase (NAD(P)+)
LVPAALELAINKSNADEIKAKLIAEGSNGSSTFEGDLILQEKNILVIPDILCNSSGVTCSYLEWLKNIDHRTPGRLEEKYEQDSKVKMLKAIEEKLRENGIKIDFSNISESVVKGASDLDLVYSALDSIMSKAIEKIYKYSVEKKINLRKATYAVAIERIYNVLSAVPL